MSVTRQCISSRIGTVLSPNGNGDLQACFGTTNMSKAWYFLNAPINKWSRCKPFRNPNIFADHYNESNSQRMAALAAADYALQAPVARNSIAATLSDEWVYLRCRQNIDPLRVWDFEQYNHLALPPVRAMGDIVIYRAMTGVYDFSAAMSHNMLSQDSITWADLGSLSDYYMCVAFCDTKNFAVSDKLLFKTSSGKVGTADDSVTIDSADMDVLTYNGIKYYYLCACSYQKTGLTDAIQAGRFITLPADATSDLLASIAFSSAIFKTARITGAARTATPTALDFLDVSRYTGLMTIDQPDSEYMPFTNGNYYLHFRLEVTALDDANATLNTSTLRVDVSQTFAGGNPKSLGTELYDQDYNKKGSITIPKGTTQTVYVVFPSIQIMAVDATGAQNAIVDTGQRFTSMFTFKQNGASFMQLSLRVRN